MCKRTTLQKTKNGFQNRLSLNAVQKYCRMHSAIFSTFIKLPLAIKIFVFFIFEWPFYTGFTVCTDILNPHMCINKQCASFQVKHTIPLFSLFLNLNVVTIELQSGPSLIN